MESNSSCSSPKLTPFVSTNKYGGYLSVRFLAYPLTLLSQILHQQVRLRLQNNSLSACYKLADSWWSLTRLSDALPIPCLHFPSWDFSLLTSMVMSLSRSGPCRSRSGCPRSVRHFSILSVQPKSFGCSSCWLMLLRSVVCSPFKVSAMGRDE